MWFIFSENSLPDKLTYDVSIQTSISTKDQFIQTTNQEQVDKETQTNKNIGDLVDRNTLKSMLQ